METESAQNELLITLTSDIVAAHVSNNSVAVSDVNQPPPPTHANSPLPQPEFKSRGPHTRNTSAPPAASGV